MINLLNYKIKISSSQAILFIFETQYDVLTLYLVADIQANQQIMVSIINRIDSVLTGIEKEICIDQNLCNIKIEKEKVHIVNKYANDILDKDCFIATAILKNIIFLYYQECKKFLLINNFEAIKKIDFTLLLYTFLASVYHKEVDFKESFDFYIGSESGRSIRALKRQIQCFLAADVEALQKRAYIKHCADGIDFEKQNIDPLVWLGRQLDLFPKTNQWVDRYLWPLIDWISAEYMHLKKFLRGE